VDPTGREGQVSSIDTSSKLAETNYGISRLKALSEKVANAQKHMEELQGYMYDAPAFPTNSSRPY
jgi:hypothetical protein